MSRDGRNDRKPSLYLRTKLKLSKRNGIVRVSSVNSFKAAPLPIYMFSFFYLQHAARSRFWSSSLKNHPPLWSDNLAWLERKPLLVGSHHASSKNTVNLLEIEPAFPLSDTVIPRNKLICGRAAGIGEAGWMRLMKSLAADCLSKSVITSRHYLWSEVVQQFHNFSGAQWWDWFLREERPRVSTQEAGVFLSSKCIPALLQAFPWLIFNWLLLIQRRQLVSRFRVISSKWCNYYLWKLQ